MVEIKFIEDKSTPYGFSVEPVDKSRYEKTTYDIHLDTEYVKMNLLIDDMCISYLFDKNRNYISWKQREKEIEKIEDETITFSNTYKVVRKREIHFGVDDYYETASEYFYDRLYYKAKFQHSQRYYKITPIETIYKEFNESNKTREAWNNKRKINEEKYLNPKTPKKEKIEILDEEVGCLVGVLAYHPMVRDSDKLVNLANYEEYEKRYFSKVENKEENYIEYLKAYCSNLRDCCVDDIDAEKEIEFIKDKCKEAKLLDFFNDYMKNNSLIF